MTHLKKLLRFMAVPLPVLALLVHYLMGLVSNVVVTCQTLPSLAVWLNCQGVRDLTLVFSPSPLADMLAREFLVAALTCLLVSSIAGPLAAQAAILRAFPKLGSRITASVVTCAVALFMAHRSFIEVRTPWLPHLSLLQRPALSHVIDSDRFMGGGYALAMFVTSYLAVAAAFTLWPLSGKEKTTEQRIAEVADRLSGLQTILYGGTAFLASSVLVTVGYVAWALAQITVAHADAAIKTVALSTGLLYSLGLFSIYLPAALVVRHRAASLARDILPAGSRTTRLKWLTKHGIGMSLGEQVASALAVLGPVLAGGPALAIADLFSSH